MKLHNVKIVSFKNLKNFEIHFDPQQMNTILLGQNATGKSNFLEALILIFKYLDLNKTPTGTDYFDYTIAYLCHGHEMEVTLHSGKYTFVVDGKKIPKSQFVKNKSYLPTYVFTYYSGQSQRLSQLFWDHQKCFYSNIIKKDFFRDHINDLRRLFYVQPVHSFFVLMAFYAFPQEEEQSKAFLKDIFQIEDIESILFVLRKPSTPWRGEGDPRFWRAEGLVKEFLQSVWAFALAPIYHEESIDLDFRTKKTIERLYLYLSNKTKLTQAVERYFKTLGTAPNNTNLFKALEATYISELLEETRIKVRKNIDGKISFRELSEGEQQLLTVLGLLKFTKDEESLILLDEPDTHLNPLWKWNYLSQLNEVLGLHETNTKTTSQVIINTHDPLVIGSLLKEQVRIFQRDPVEGQVVVETPDVDPRGLGVAGILTSELFGLPTTLDQPTIAKINERDALVIKKQKESLDLFENETLDRLNEELQRLGFNQINRDPLYQKFRIALSKQERFQKPQLTKEERIAQDKLAESILKEIMEDEP